jgi:hypothetical protein
VLEGEEEGGEGRKEGVRGRGRGRGEGIGGRGRKRRGCWKEEERRKRKKGREGRIWMSDPFSSQSTRS